MRELSSSAFPLGETSLHLLHTPDGNMFVTADLAVKLFDSAPATFAEFVRANRYVRVNAMERAVVRLCASLGIPPETAGGDKPVPVAAAAVARDETVREDPNAKGGSANADAAGPKDAVTLLPEKTVLAILEDRRAPRRAAQFRETAARRSFVAAERLARQGAFADALPLALDAVRRAQDIHETPRARRMAAEAAEREARARRASSSGSPSGAKRNPRETSVTNTGGTSAPHVALFEPYLLAASIALALGKTEACDSTLGLASWIALRRGDAVSETQRARLKRLRGELRSRQGRTRDALEEFASAAVHAAEASGPQTPRVALELFKLADAFRETRAEDLGPDGDEARGEARDDETETETETDAAANTAGSPHVNPTTTESALSASRCDAAATRIWLAAAADALGLLEESSAAAGAIAAFESRLKLTFSRQSRARSRTSRVDSWRRPRRRWGASPRGRRRALAKARAIWRRRRRWRAAWFSSSRANETSRFLTRRTRRTKTKAIGTETKANPPTRRSRRRSRRLSRASRRRSRRSRRRRTARRSRERRWRGGAAPRVDARRSDRRRDSRRDPREEEGCGST